MPVQRHCVAFLSPFRSGSAGLPTAMQVTRKNTRPFRPRVSCRYFTWMHFGGWRYSPGRN